MANLQFRTNLDYISAFSGERVMQIFAHDFETDYRIVVSGNDVTVVYRDALDGANRQECEFKTLQDAKNFCNFISSSKAAA